jgi:aldehyde:ferredoxin oxidoreductase
LSVGAKSPLTGGVKEANVGGEAGQKLARIGVRALIVEDAPDVPECRILLLSRDGAEWMEEPSLAGIGVRETFVRLRERFGPSHGLVTIGPAGEMRMAAAGVATTDADGVQVRYAARGGLGAVMGSKGIKAIVIDDRDGEIAAGEEPARLRDAAKRFAAALLADPKLDGRRKFGTAGIVATASELGLLPTRNFSAGSFGAIDGISGATLAETIAARGGEGRSGTACMTGCVIRCSNVFPNADGSRAVATLQYENIALLGSNCGIATLDGIAELNARCNDLGLDAIEMGGVLGVAMDAGLAQFGDVEAAAKLLDEVGDATPLGRILGQGVVFAGQALGVRRVPAVNGQGIPGYDPRALKGNGVTYVTSSMGADHTAGNAFGSRGTVDPLGCDGQIENARALQIRSAILDTSGLCLFARGPIIAEPELLAELANGRFGWEISFGDIAHGAASTLGVERAFNAAAGHSDLTCDVPEFMRTEPLPPHGAVYDIAPEEMQRIWTVETNTRQF